MDPVVLFKKRWSGGKGNLTVFSHGTTGVPTLGDMGDLAKHLGAVVDHAGMGVFIARKAGKEVFSFNAGTMMTREEGFSWDNMDVAEGHRKTVLAWLRKKYPGLIGPVAKEMGGYWKNPDFLEVVPSYGRDYKTQKEVLAAWNADKDFTIVTLGPDDGRQINKRDAENGGVYSILIRYDRLRKVVAVKPKTRANPCHKRR